MWRLLNETRNRNIRKQSTQEFSHNNGTTSDPEVIANTFNEYFINIGGSLAEQIPEAPLFHVYFNNLSEPAFSFQPVSEEMISIIVKTRGTRGVRVVFFRARMRSSNSAGINKSYFYY